MSQPSSLAHGAPSAEAYAEPRAAAPVAFEDSKATAIDALALGRGVLVLLMTIHHVSIPFSDRNESNVITANLIFIQAAFVLMALVGRTAFPSRRSVAHDLAFGCKLLLLFLAANLAFGFLSSKSIIVAASSLIDRIRGGADARYAILYILSIFILLPRRQTNNEQGLIIALRTGLSALLIFMALGKPLLQICLGLGLIVLALGEPRLIALINAIRRHCGWATSIGLPMMIAIAAFGLIGPLYALYTVLACVLMVSVGSLSLLARAKWLISFIRLMSRYSLELYLLQVTVAGVFELRFGRLPFDAGVYLAVLAATLVAQSLLCLWAERSKTATRVLTLVLR